MTGKKKRKVLPSLLSLPLAALYEELLLKLCVNESPVFDRTLFYIAGFSCGTALVIWGAANLVRARKLGRWMAALFLFALGFLSAVEYCVHFYYGTFFEFAYMLSMVSSVARDFGGEAVDTVIKSWWYILLAMLPFVLYFLSRKKQTPKKRYLPRYGLAAVAVGFLFIAAPSAALRLKIKPFAQDSAAYGSAYTINSALPRFGLITSFRLEAQ